MCQDACGNDQHAVAANPKASDSVSPLVLRNSVVLDSVEVGALFHIPEPDPAWRNEEDCGLDADCTGLYNAMFWDADGAALGEAGQVLSRNSPAFDGDAG